MIRITDSISIDDAELDEQFIRASGPGGQNVNKVASAVELRFDVAHSSSLPGSVKARLARLAGSRMTKDGVIVIRADRFRSQEQNRADARERLAELVIAAAHVPKRRIKTKPTLGSKERRLAGKAQRSKVKGLRGKKPSFD
jgi:ribosome-associated protein